MSSAFSPQHNTAVIAESGWGMCGSVCRSLEESERYEVAENESKLSGEAE